MHTSRYAIAGLALVASTVMISCGSDNNSTPSNTGVGNTTSGVTSDTTLTSDSLAISDTSVVDTTLP